MQEITADNLFDGFLGMDYLQKNTSIFNISAILSFYQNSKGIYL